MENPALYRILQNIENPSVVSSVVLEDQIEVQLHTAASNTVVSVKGLAPFHTVEDLHRAVWLQRKKEYELYPKYSCMLVEEEDGKFTPAMGTFQELTLEGSSKVLLPDPRITISQTLYQESFVDADGTRTPIDYFQRGRTTLEDAFLKPFGSMPRIHIYSFQSLLQLFRGAKPISQRDWNGLFYPYFPSLKPTTNGEMTPEDVAQAERVELYIQAKLDQVRILDACLEDPAYPELKTVAIRYLSFQWTEKQPEFEGVEPLFYRAAVNSSRPYMRLLSPNTTPMTKLYRPTPLAPPQVSDPVLLREWVDESIPILNSSFLISKLRLRTEEPGLPSLYATLRLTDDGTGDCVLQPASNQRSLDFQRDLAQFPELFSESAEDLQIPVESIKLGRANLSVQFQFTKLPPKDFRTKMQNRIGYFSTFFQRTEPPKEEQAPILSLRYKAVSNFFGLSEDKISSYLAYVFNRKGVQAEATDSIAKELAAQFQISQDDALTQILRYLEKGAEHTLADSEGKDFLVAQNPGIDISIYATDIKTFSAHFYNLRAISIDDFLRACTILSVIFYTPDSTWNEVFQEEDVELDEEEQEAIRSAEAEVLGEQLQEEEELALDVGTVAGLDEEFGLLAEEGDEKDQSLPFVVPPATLVKATVNSKTQQQQQQQQQQQEQSTTQSQKIVSHQWFIKQLQRLDPVLFKYKAEKSKGELHYSSTCASNEDRQPAILTQDQFQNMRSIYAQDEAESRVGFIIYGVPETEETIKAAEGKLEQITVLRYGSDVTNLHYYLCSLYFCLADNLPILEADWKSTTDKQGGLKDANSCPFCHGTLIENRRDPEEGGTVIRRKNKPKTNKPQLFIRFQEGHPDGYGLPCCFPKREDIGWKDPHFTRMREATKQSSAVGTAIEAKEQEDAEQKETFQESLQLRIQQVVSYEVLRYKISREYVLGPEKYPLEPGKIGLPTIALDTYFGQDSAEMVQRVAIKQEFKPSAQGFFRLGVLNKSVLQSQSLFAALAPLLGKSTIQEVQSYMKNRITPRVFLGLNFGNLLLEFFTPSDPEPPIGVLHNWSLKFLQNPNTKVKEELSRLYRSYHRFLRYIDDVTQVKQLRHFAHALAEPNVLFQQGLNIITLEYKGDPRDLSTDIQVRCPMAGFDTARYSRNMIGFLTLHPSGIWEPLVYISRLGRKDITPVEQEGHYVIPYGELVQPSFSPIVRQRYSEFMTMCGSAYRGAFTIQQGVDSRALVPLTRAIEMLQPTGLVRDSYNHLVAVTVKGSDGLDILVPVVDDGNTFYNNTDLKIHLGFQSLRLSSANAVLDLYESTIEPTLGKISTAYNLKVFLLTTKTVGFTLGSEEGLATITLPCGNKIANEEFDFPEEVIKEPDQFRFEYEINRELQFGERREESYPENPYLIQKQQVETIYEHLRLSFSTWVATHEGGGQMRNSVEALIERKDIPSWEKLRRLKVEFGGLLQMWFARDPNPFAIGPILLRNDCIAIEDDEELCGKSVMCRFQDGSCRIHTPDKVQVNTKGEPLDSVEYFTTRLFDELLRIPIKRKELLSRGVKRIQVPSTNIQIGTAWILPENVPAWYDLLREPTKQVEAPMYYEEFSRLNSSSQKDTDQQALLDAGRFYAIPQELQELLAADVVEQLGMRVVGKENGSKTKELLHYFGMDSTVVDSDMMFSSKVLSEISRKYNNIPVIQVLVGQTPVGILGRKYTVFENMAGVLVVVPDYRNGPAVVGVLRTGSDIIPREFVRGPILDSITEERVVLRRKPATGVQQEQSLLPQGQPQQQKTVPKLVRPQSQQQQQPQTSIVPNLVQSLFQTLVPQQQQQQQPRVKLVRSQRSQQPQQQQESKETNSKETNSKETNSKETNSKETNSKETNSKEINSKETNSNESKE